MDGLTEGDAYVAEIRVGGWSVNPQSPGTFHIGASDASHADIHQTGASQTLSEFIPSVEAAYRSLRLKPRDSGWLLDAFASCTSACSVKTKRVRDIQLGRKSKPADSCWVCLLYLHVLI